MFCIVFYGAGPFLALGVFVVLESCEFGLTIAYVLTVSFLFTFWYNTLSFIELSLSLPF